ncbi:MAG: Gfo/Idh/MocA family oxidoreductase, partial [Candidatus Peribacteraceae bacterium]
MPKTSLGIGIIGAGFGASVQLPGFLGLPEARVIGIASKDGKKTEELSKKFNLPKKFSSPDELIACGEIDLVSVAVPPFAQQELILKAIKAG